LHYIRRAIRDEDTFDLKMKSLIIALAVFCLADARPRAGASVHGDTSTPFIIGGEDLPIGEAPQMWQLSMENTGSHSCGAVLIAAGYAMTAAHCTVNAATALLVIKGGFVDRATTPELDSDVSSKTEHPLYSGGSPGFPNDICVLTLATEADLTSANLTAATKPAAGQDFMSSSCVISGWGIPTSVSAGGVTQHCRFAYTNVISNTDCALTMTNVGGAAVLDGHICLWNPDPDPNNDHTHTGSCNGDSGGPLSCRTSNTTTDWIVAGVTSWGVRDSFGCTPDYPSVYTRVSYYLEFITGICNC
jgi:secreted trypsin-like serine protease